MKPNILFLLIDSFREDKCYGNNKSSITPNLDSLIENGIYFTQAIPSGTVTCPSISSIFTSRYPFESIIKSENHFKLDTNVPTHLDDLLDYGYHLEALIPELISYMGFKKIFSNNVRTYHSSSTLYDGVGERIIEKLNSFALNEPWFYYIHLLDLHGTAIFQLDNEPQEFKDKKYGINQYERMVSCMDNWLGKILEKVDFEKTLVVLTSDHGNDTGVYTPNIENYRKKTYEFKTGLGFKTAHLATTKLPKFLNPVRKKLSNTYTKRKNTIIENKKDIALDQISTKDLRPYEKRLLENSIESTLDVYDNRLRVPLIFSGYGIKSGRKIHEQVRSIDIFPTIAKIINVPEKRSSIRGQSLLDLVNGKYFEELPVMIDSVPNSEKSLSSNVIGIRTSKYKYFRSRNDSHKDVNLFDLENDPLEENNIVDKHPEIVSEMEKSFEAIVKNKVFEFKTESKPTESDENSMIEKELKKLGYI